jgi:glycogen debranching enzyme
MKSTLLALADYADRACGRIPHEVTTNGRVFNPGNTQETPQFAIACWDYFRWTGDVAFLRRVYPICREGVMDYVPSVWGAGKYPTGDAMVERHGMGAYKLDSICYLMDALEKLCEMAHALDMPDDIAEYTKRLDDFKERFERDWWIEGEDLYADSLNNDLSQKSDGHWTVIVPLQLGQASPDRARRSFARIKRDWINEWGLVHTRGDDERVWTLPTGLAALAAFRYGEPELGVQLLQNIALTAGYGMLGAFKELIPIGLCFVQLWSAGLYVQGLLEGALGLEPRAHQHQLSIAPNLPSSWPEVRLSQIVVGTHTLSLQVSSSALEVRQVEGTAPLTIRFRVPADSGKVHVDTSAAVEVAEEQNEMGRWVCATVKPERRLVIDASAQRVLVEVLD